MANEPTRDFTVAPPALTRLADALEKADATSLQEAFPAALLAATWRALLENGVIEAPEQVALDRVEVLVAGTEVLELRVPVRTRTHEIVKAVPVLVQWTASGDLIEQLGDEAERLTQALELAVSLPAFDHDRGPGQKPHN
jgi:hypothetical protein